MKSRVAMERGVKGRRAEIQLEEREAVGVSRVTVRFLDRFSGSVSHLPFEVLSGKMKMC